MHPLFEEFMGHLAREDKDACVGFALDRLQSGSLDVVSLYTEILGPALNGPVCSGDGPQCIWKEHARTSIVRTIIECAYPFVASERKRRGPPRGRKAVIACPSEEYHEIGARMAADFLTILGFDVTFVGANTPRRDLLDAIALLRPAIVGISVSNFYNLVAARNLVGDLAALRKEKGLDFRVVAGGGAFAANPHAGPDMGVDAVLQTFPEIEAFCRGV